MPKKLNPEKLTLGIRKEIRKDVSVGNGDIETAVQKIHSATSVTPQEVTKRTTLDIPKDLHKKISMNALSKDLTLKDYFLDLVKRDLGIE